ncbi:MAG TPA: WXG100 family type VII secretion target, partial [Candidatus Dormibacteraeota bacterium]|nr:WXG100 family type VII secretion target [Candidatus Dormibacteraeota bacterium]
MSGIIRVTPEQLQAVSGQLNAGAGNIDGALRQLGSSVEPLGGDWAGVAQARFQELWGQWQRDALGLHDSLTEISRLMAQAAAN